MFYKLPAAKVSLVEVQLFGKIFFQVLDKFNKTKTSKLFKKWDIMVEIGFNTGLKLMEMHQNCPIEPKYFLAFRN